MGPLDVTPTLPSEQTANTVERIVASLCQVSEANMMNVLTEVLGYSVPISPVT